jgi:hypothetical protein
VKVFAGFAGILEKRKLCTWWEKSIAVLPNTVLMFIPPTKSINQRPHKWIYLQPHKTKALIDNITLVRDCKPMPQLNKAKGKPFEYNGIIYSPKYVNGQIIRYEGYLKNLRLYVYPQRAYLFNSLHKYWHGCNHNSFYLSEANAAIEKISQQSGIDWQQAIVKKVEYGCNIPANAGSIIHSLKSYKAKDFQPMIKTGKQYGASCGFEQYRIKGYDKEFEVMKVDKINIGKPLFRWEIQVINTKYLNKFKQPLTLTVKQLLQPGFCTMLANDAVTIFNKSIKMQKLQLNKLTAHEKKVLAAMLHTEIREDLKHHNKETYKRDRRIYQRIMADKNICINEDTGELMEEKFKQLVDGIRAEEKQIIKITTSSL